MEIFILEKNFQTPLQNFFTHSLADEKEKKKKKKFYTQLCVIGKNKNDEII